MSAPVNNQPLSYYMKQADLQAAIKDIARDIDVISESIWKLKQRAPHAPKIEEVLKKMPQPYRCQEKSLSFWTALLKDLQKLQEKPPKTLSCINKYGFDLLDALGEIAPSVTYCYQEKQNSSARYSICNYETLDFRYLNCKLEPIIRAVIDSYDPNEAPPTIKLPNTFWKLNEKTSCREKAGVILNGLLFRNTMPAMTVLNFIVRDQSKSSNYQFSVTKAVSGTPLNKHFAALELSENQTVGLNDIDHESFCEAVILSFIALRRDGHAGNYVLTQQKKIVQIDNNELFGPETSNQPYTLENILYFFPHMEEPIPTYIYDFFNDLIPELVVAEWLTLLARENEKMQNHFPKSKLKIKLPKEQLNMVYSTLAKIKKALSANPHPNYNLNSLFKFLFKDIALHYEKTAEEFNEANALSHRFCGLFSKARTHSNPIPQILGLLGIPMEPTVLLEAFLEEHCVKNPSESMTNFIATSSFLSRISFNRCTALTNAHLNTMATSMPKLQRLTLTKCNNITREGLLTLHGQRPQIELVIEQSRLTLEHYSLLFSTSTLTLVDTVSKKKILSANVIDPERSKDLLYLAIAEKNKNLFTLLAYNNVQGDPRKILARLDGHRFNWRRYVLSLTILHGLKYHFNSGPKPIEIRNCHHPQKIFAKMDESALDHLPTFSHRIHDRMHELIISRSAPPIGEGEVITLLGKKPVYALDIGRMQPLEGNTFQKETLTRIGIHNHLEFLDISGQSLERLDIDTIINTFFKGKDRKDTHRIQTIGLNTDQILELIQHQVFFPHIFSELEDDSQTNHKNNLKTHSPAKNQIPLTKKSLALILKRYHIREEFWNKIKLFNRLFPSSIICRQANFQPSKQENFAQQIEDLANKLQDYPDCQKIRTDCLQTTGQLELFRDKFQHVSLISLDLSNTAFGNNPAILTSLGSMLQSQKNLKVLDLSNCNLQIPGHGGIRPISDFIDAIAEHSSLEQLYLNGNDIDHIRRDSLIKDGQEKSSTLYRLDL